MQRFEGQYSRSQHAHFGKGALVKEPLIANCAQFTEAAAKCSKIVVKYQPDNLNSVALYPAALDETGGV